MVSLVYIGFGILRLVLLIMAVRELIVYKRLYLLFLVLTLFGLAYDNFSVGFGRFIGEGDLLQSLNTPRYVIHALITPLLILVGLHLARNAGVSWAFGRKTTAFFIVVTILLIALGALVDIVRLDLEVVFDSDAIRYANGASVGPPVPAIVTVIMLIACGIGIARKTGWYWLLAASIFMFVASAAGATIGLITNLGELVFALGLVATARHFPPPVPEQAQPVNARQSPAEV
ncbi:MAG: hypothetical protein M9941_05140 [Anaerolineae bacterium]|nr:hypothetical protein [Anaerolineae bacterium]